ncbi:NAD(P)-dependent alcohol dehydrogenase [candidate division KSB1 bacterium]
MKAAYLNGPGRVELKELEVPVPGDGEALVRIGSVGVCASDVHYFRDGRIGDTVAEGPVILGHEAAGTIESVGKGVDNSLVGHRVALEPGVPCGSCEHCLGGNYNLCPDIKFFGSWPVDGCYSQYITHPARFCYHLPDNLSDDSGALVETLSVCLNAFNLAKPRIGDTVAVIGAGPVGILCVGLARLAGAAQIIAVERLPSRLSVAARYGAEVTIANNQTDPVAAVMEATDGRGVDIAIEAGGDLETPQMAVDISRPGAKVILIGICPEDRIPLASTAVRRKGLTIKLVRRMRHNYPRAVLLAARGMIDLDPLATHHFPLSDLGRAMQLVAERGDGVIKAVIRPNP